jgi:uroporphyrinogen decarboxylase
MTSKERVFRAIRRGPLPDRVPVQFDLCRALTEHFSRELGLPADYALSYYEDLTYRISANAIRTRMGSDCVVVGGTVARGFTAGRVAADVTVNEFGMHMKPTALYVEAVKCPLEEASTPADIARYALPDPRAPGRFDAARRDIDRFGAEYFVIGDVELSLFELAWHLSGIEKYLMALISGDAWVGALNDQVQGWTLGLCRQLVSAGVDALWFGEDLGSQTSTLISPDMWRELFKPRYKAIFDELRGLKKDLVIIMHSDGAVAPLLDDFIELGVDVYNPVQPNVPGSDPRELKEKYGSRISFFGGIDQQELLPRGDLPRIREEIETRVRTLGAGGGYLLAPAHIIQADVRPEVVTAMLGAARECGTYR